MNFEFSLNWKLARIERERQSQTAAVFRFLTLRRKIEFLVSLEICGQLLNTREGVLEIRWHLRGAKQTRRAAGKSVN